MATLEYKVDKLSTGNYTTWKVIITSQLKSKDLWDYVISTKIEQDEDIVNNEKAKSILYTAMEPRQIAATGVCETAHELWTKIQENHEGAQINMRNSSLAEFLSLKAHRNENLIQFAGRFETLLGKLEVTGHEVDESTKLWVFSNSLPQQYKLTVQMFSIAKPKGTVKELISQLKVQYHLDEQLSTKREVALSTNDSRPQHCKEDRPNSASDSCTYCKKPGHRWKQCRKLKADNERKKQYASNKQNGQNRNRYPQQSNQRPNERPNNKPKDTSRHSGALTTKYHRLSDGKFSWIIDSGASSHMTPYRDFLISYQSFETPKEIFVGDGRSLNAYGIGTMPFTSDKFNGELTMVMWIPDLTENLLSIGRTIEMGCNVKFRKTDSTVNFYRNDKLILQGVKREASVYFTVELTPNIKENNEIAMLGASLEEWHQRLGHCSIDSVKSLIKSNAVTGLVVSNNSKHECEACILGKLCRASHPTRQTITASETAAVLHFDTVGPMKHLSLGNARYFLLGTEEYSGYKFFDTLASKVSIPNSVKQIINETELLSNRSVKAIFSDCGSEFTNNSLYQWLREKGIIHRLSVAETPQQNGLAERSNQTVLNGIRTLLSQSKLTESLWAESLNTFIYTYNRTLSRKVPDKTHYELLTGKKPDLSNLRVFGQKAIIKETDKYRDGKLAPKGNLGIFVGYTDRHNTYRFYLDKPIEQVIRSCDARFLQLESNKAEAEATPSTETYTARVDTDDNSDTEIDSDATEIDEETGSIASEEPSLIQRVTRSIARNLGGRNEAEGAMLTLSDEPMNVKDAKNRSDWAKWKEAMDAEMDSLKENGTWILVNKPQNARTIKNRWIFKIKTNPDGTIERYKARLVAKGFTQIPNVDFKETYAPVATMTTIRLLLAVANQNSMEITQFDIKTAFLNGDLDEDLYMEQPEGYIEDPLKVCKLVKSLYGLKQSPRQWNKKFTSFITEFNLNQSGIDRCLYFNNNRTLILVIYVDDGLIISRDTKEMKRLVNYLKSNFDMRVMDCKVFLGINITRNSNDGTLDLDQKHYVDSVLERFGMLECKIASTPEQPGDKFTESEKLPTDNQFRELLGCLLYLATSTRPDISHAVNVASRTAAPTQAHWNALKRILRYLKGTSGYGIRFRRESKPKLIGYSDADYANEEESRKSTTGYCIYFGGGPIAWRCQRQPIITLSTTEAEYVAGSELTKEIIPIKNQLVELKQIPEKEPVNVFIDNQSTVRIATNEAGQIRTKHIDVRAKWLTEQVNNKTITVSHISGEEQPADILTKPLYKTKFENNRSKLLTLISMIALMAILMPATEGRKLRLTDPISLIETKRMYVDGDIRYKLRNVFVNPCEVMFNHTSSVSGTITLIKKCFEYFDTKHLKTLSKCKRAPNIGPDLTEIPLSYNCDDQLTSNTNQTVTGKCSISRRKTMEGQLPDLELDAIQESWNVHKKKVNELPTLKREKRFLPVLIPILTSGLTALGITIGPVMKTYKIADRNSENIELLANVTNLHSEILRESTEFFEQYKNSIQSLHQWAQEVEDRMDEFGISWHSPTDTINRGKTAQLVKSYMTWFDQQAVFLTELNQALSMGQISPNMKIMLNGTSNFDRMANRSNVLNCIYRLDNKNMVLDLEFIIPSMNEDMSILEVRSIDHYEPKNFNSSNKELCWTKYTGPKHAIFNKTNECLKMVNKQNTDRVTIRDQTCTVYTNEIYHPVNKSSLWTQENTCKVKVEPNEDRISIDEIYGAHKVYCYPFNITIGNETFACPMEPIILEGHATYKLANISHTGVLIDTTVSRSLRRRRRSPVTDETTKAPEIVVTPTVSVTDAENSLDRVENFTRRMENTINKIRITIKSLPDRLNMTKAQIEDFLDKPLETIMSGMNRVGEYFKSIGAFMGTMSVIMFIVVLIPVVELAFTGIRIIRFPANLWIGSFHRVSHTIRSNLRNNIFTNRLNPSRRHRWNNLSKIV